MKISDLKLKRLEIKQARKKIGAHYLKYREQKDDGDLPSENDKKTDENDSLQWLKEIQKDPYISESVSILNDMNLYPYAATK